MKEDSYLCERKENVLFEKRTVMKGDKSKKKTKTMEESFSFIQKLFVRGLCVQIHVYVDYFSFCSQVIKL